MLRLSQEILLLLLDNESGDVKRIPENSLALALSGSVLMDLSFENRIDTDLDHLELIDPTPLGDPLLDPTLAAIAKSDRSYSTRYWLDQTAARSKQIRETAIDRLIDQDILSTDHPGFLALQRAIEKSRKYPVIDGKAEEEVQLRMIRVLLEGDIPNPRDVAIVCLAEACGIFQSILEDSTNTSRTVRKDKVTQTRFFRRPLLTDDLPRLRERIALISRMDLIGRAVVDAIRVSEGEPQRVAPESASTKEIPRIPGLPLVGNLLALFGDRQKLFTEQHMKLGPVFQIVIPGKTIVVLAGVEANNFVNKHSRDYFRSLELWAPLDREVGSAKSIFATDGDDHYRLRKVVQPGFSRTAGEECIEDVLAIVRKAINSWPVNERIPVWKEFSEVTVEQLGIIGTGVSSREYIDDIRIFWNALLMSQVARMRPKFIMHLPRIRRARKRVEELSARVVDSHKPSKRKGSRRDLIDDLLDLHHSDPQFMPETDLFFSVLGPFLAGIDTVTSTCSFMLYSLLKHPDILDEMRRECDALFAPGVPSLESIRNLDVTRRVAMETMRMYPVTSLTVRRVTNSFEFSGYRIPAGQTVILPNTVPHNLPDVFPDPKKFDIGRYTANRNEHRQPGALTPFGVGTHRCIASTLADWQIALNMAAVVHHTTMTLDPPNYSLRTVHRPNPMPDSSFKVRVVERR